LNEKKELETKTGEKIVTTDNYLPESIKEKRLKK